MKFHSVIILAAGALLESGVAPHLEAAAQTSASASSSTAVQANKFGAQASSDTSASASANAGQSSVSLSGGTSVNATLSQPVDARKNKPGDQVTATATETIKSEGRVVIPRGSKLIGHVTQCKARSKEEKESALGILFDKAVWKSGQQIPLNVTIQALAAAQSATLASAGADDFPAGAGAGATGTARGSGASTLGGVRSTAGAATGAVANTAANVGGIAGGAVGSTVNAAGATRGPLAGLKAAGQLTSNSQGVFGLNGLKLSSAAPSSMQGSLITSTTKNVHLDSGTQLLLVAQSQASVQGTMQ
jgi:hypothetical protein